MNDSIFMAPRVGIFIQARSNSGRLPGKIYAGLPDQNGPSILEHIYRRLSSLPEAQAVAVLAPENDERLIRYCREREMTLVVGPEEDVRERYRIAAREFETDIVVRATGDNPCVDPEAAAATIREILKREVDLLSFINLPLGVAVEAFRRAALDSDVVAAEDSHREHVSVHIKRNPRYFRVEHPDFPLVGPEVKKNLRLTVDTAEDLAVARKVYRELGFDFSAADALELFRLRPELFAGNQHIKQRVVATA